MNEVLSAFDHFLGSLRRRRWLLLLMATASTAAAGMFLLTVYDWILPVQERTALWLTFAVLVISVGAAWRLRARCFANVRSVQSIATRLETADREWNDLLVTAADLAAKPASQRSGPLQREVLRQAAARLHGSNWRQNATFPWERWRVLAACAALTCAAVTLALLSHPARKAAFHLGALFGWMPQGIELQQTSFEVARGNDLAVAIRVTRWQKEALVISRQHGDRQPLPLALDEDGAGSMVFFSVEQDFHFRVTTPSLQSAWIHVHAYDPPRIDSIEMQWQPPAYTGWETGTSQQLTDLRLLEGTVLKITASAPLAAETVWQGPTNQTFSKANKDGWFELTHAPAASGEYRLMVTDSIGRSLRSAPHQLTVVSDQPPVIEILAPERDAVLRPDQEVPIHLFASDDIGLADGRIVMALSGKDLPPQAFAYPPTETGSAPLEADSLHPVQLAGIGAADGDLLSFYVEVADNRQPEPNITRTDLVFVEIRSPIEPVEMDGMPMETRELDLREIISEQKRLMRESHRALGMPQSTEREERIHELNSSLSALQVEIRRVFVDLEGDLYAGGREDLIELFKAAIDGVGDAITSIQRQRVSDIIPSQAAALSAMLKIENALRTNVTSREPAEGESGEGQGESGESGESDEQQQQAIQQAAEAINELLREQNARNNVYDRAARNGWAQAAASTESQLQAELASSTAALQSALQRVPQTTAVRSALAAARRQMATAAASANRSDAPTALRAGLRAREALRNASAELESMLADAAANAFASASERAQALANAQAQAAQASTEADAEGAFDTTGLEENQRALNQQLDALVQQLAAQSNQLAGRDPEAAQALRELTNALREGPTPGRMERAANALLYGQSGTAAGLQQQAANDLGGFADALQQAASQLAADPMRRASAIAREMQRAMETLAAQAQDPQMAAADQIQQLREQMSGRLEELQQIFSDSRFGSQANAIAGGGSGDTEADIGQARAILGQSAALLQQYLTQAAAAAGMQFNREAAPPPDRYRKMVEEYFRRLATDPEENPQP
jgi:hypothetical protein